MLRSEKLENAKSLYYAIRDEQNHNLRALEGLGKAVLMERNWKEALAFSNQVIEIDRENVTAHYIAAVASREIGAFAFREPGYSGPSRYGDWGQSRKHFTWILERDSSFEDVLYQFALLHRYEGDRDGAMALDSVQIMKRPDLLGPQVGRYTLLKYFMVTEDSSNFITWLEQQPGSLPRYFMAETFRRHENFAAAESLLTELLYHPGDVSPQAVRLSLARLRSQQGDRPAAEAEYWKAVQELRSPLGSAILLEDLKYILSDGEFEYYNTLDLVNRQRDFFRSFWNFRNPSLALGTNSRLREHIRRFVHAEQAFEYYGARTSFNNPDRQHELSFPRAFALNDEFNDMGLIYIRQGDPDDVVRHDYSPFDENITDSVPSGKHSGVGVGPIDEQVRAQEILQRALDNQHLFTYAHDSFESWLYDATAESPRMMFHFQKHNAVGNNWRLVAVPSLDAMIGELAIWDSKFQRLYMGLEDDRLPLQTQLKFESKEVVRYALSTEKQTWEKKTERFQFPHSIDLFRAPDGRTLLDVSYAIPLASLSRNLPDSVESIPVEIGFSLVDSKSHHAAVQRDTMDVGLSRTRTGAIIDLIRYTVPPDSYAVSMHIRPLIADMIGTWRQTLRVRDFSRPGFMMSSVQFLRPSSEMGALAIDGVKVVQSPFRTVVRTEPFYLYFQIYHLVPDGSGNTAYLTECLLLPQGEEDPGHGRVVYRKEKTGKEEMSAEFCRVDLHAVDPGRYRVIVNVTDRKRVQTLTAERELEILKP
jgi:tetratricopeptide (TPR) repeat protein